MNRDDRECGCHNHHLKKNLTEEAVVTTSCRPKSIINDRSMIADDDGTVQQLHRATATDSPQICMERINAKYQNEVTVQKQFMVMKSNVTTTTQIFYRRFRFIQQLPVRPQRSRPVSSSEYIATTIWRVAHLLLLLLLVQQQISQTTTTMYGVVQAASYSITLKAKDTDCYLFRVPKKPVTISGNFDCYEEGNNFVRNCRSIEVWIEAVSTGNDGQVYQQYHHHDHHDTANPYVWESSEDQSEEIFHIPINQDPEKGGMTSKYQLCFESSSKDDDEIVENEEDDKIPNSIRIGFHLRIENSGSSKRTLPDDELGPDEQRALHVIDTADTALESWHHLLDHFDYMRDRESIQDRMLHQTFKKVIGWSITEAVLVIVMAIAQVCYWKSFFEQRRYL